MLARAAVALAIALPLLTVGADAGHSDDGGFDVIGYGVSLVNQVASDGYAPALARLEYLSGPNGGCSGSLAIYAGFGYERDVCVTLKPSTANLAQLEVVGHNVHLSGTVPPACSDSSLFVHQYRAIPLVGRFDGWHTAIAATVISQHDC